MVTATAGVYFVHRTGARGDGSHDDTTPIQDLIDTASGAGGGVVYLQPGKSYACNVTLKPNVKLVGGGALPNPSQSGGTIMKAAGAGPVVDTPGSSAHGMSIEGIAFKGLGANTACQGVRLRTGSLRTLVKSCTFSNLADQAVLVDSGAIACAVEDVIAQSCLLNHTRAAKIGVFDISGTDHFFHRCEVTGSLSALTSSDAYICAWAIRDANNFFESCVGEIADEGFYLVGDASSKAFFNRFSNCRADLNFGHGFHLFGSFRNSFVACHAERNSQETNNTYSGFYVEDNSGVANGGRNLFAACIAESLASDTKKHKYGFEDKVTATPRNVYAGCRAFEYGTNAFYYDGGASAGPDTDTTVVV